MTQFNLKQWCGATPPSQMALLHLSEQIVLMPAVNQHEEVKYASGKFSFRIQTSKYESKVKEYRLRSKNTFS